MLLDTPEGPVSWIAAWRCADLPEPEAGRRVWAGVYRMQLAKGKKPETAGELADEALNRLFLRLWSESGGRNNES